MTVPEPPRGPEATGGAGPGLDDTPPHGQPPVRAPQGSARPGAVAPPKRPVATRPPKRPEPDGGPRHAGPGRPAARPPRDPSDAGRRGSRLTGRGRLVLAVVVVLLLVGGLAGWYEAEANPFGGPGKPVIVTVARGEPVDTVVGQLAHDGVIGSSFAFRLWTVVHGSPTVLPGRYQLDRNLPFSTVRALLDAGPNVHRLDVAPGTTLAELAAELSGLPHHFAQRFGRDARTGAVHSPFAPSAGSTLEGLVAAGSYQILPGESPEDLLRQMVARFDAEAAAAGLTPSTSLTGVDAYQAVIVASIAQKEGYFTRYMGEVARVIYNRLAAGMRLDMTSTVLYSLGQDGGTVTPAEEQKTTPYNTYLHPGLTPTPICVPSAAALRAAAAPPAGAWLYFDLVTAKKGTMVFSATYTGQLAAEQQAASQG